MNEAQRDTMLSWLSNAYAMETSMIETLERQIDDASERSDVQARLEEHLDETRGHAERIQERIENLGGDVSKAREFTAKMSGTMNAWSTGMGEDKLIKSGIADSAAEHLEIASYTALIAAAEALGDTETATVCRSILEDEKDMASWLEENLPILVEDHISSV